MSLRWQRIVSFSALGVLLGGVAFWTAVWWWFHSPAPDRSAIESRYRDWHSALAAERFTEAYVIMSPAYRGSNSVEQFAREFRIWGWPAFALRPERRVRVHGSGARLYPVETHWYDLYSGPVYQWKKIENQWFMTGEYQYYAD
jgi:hypothetical protein